MGNLKLTTHNSIKNPLLVIWVVIILQQVLRTLVTKLDTTKTILPASHPVHIPMLPPTISIINLPSQSNIPKWKQINNNNKAKEAYKICMP